MQNFSFRGVADRNPFYLLSACFALWGCWLLGNISREDFFDAAIRIAGVLVYQVAVVRLGIWLSNRRDTRRDAVILFVLALVLAADFSFFYTQVAMLRPMPATLLTFFGVAQALAVTGALLRGFRLEISKPGQWLLAMDLIAVHLLPLASRLVANQEAILPLAFFAAFSAAGALAAAHALPSARFAERLALVAPVVVMSSLVAHLIALEWIYQVPFWGAFASPLCLGAAAIFLRRADIGSSITLALLAIALALNHPPGAVWGAGGSSWFAMSPLRFTLASASAIFFALWSIRQNRRVFCLAAAALSLAVLGHTPETIRDHADEIYRALSRALYAVSPTSRGGWGALFVVFAFLFLGVGAWLSWWKTRVAEE
jgi:hypothetical protein